MRVRLFLLILWLLPFPWHHAWANAGQTLERWQYVQDPDSGATFSEIRDFLAQHPSWPDQKKIRIRAEYALRNGDVSDPEIVAWFEPHPPLTGLGKWLYAQALNHQNSGKQQLPMLIKEAWRDADLSESEENSLLTSFGEMLTSEDHIARVDRLLWAEKVSAARHLIPRLPVAHQLLFQARSSFILEEKNAAYLLRQITGPLKHDPGLLYERLRYRAKKRDTAGVRELLLQAPEHVPYPERWWPIREAEIRSAIDEKKYALAARLLERHGQEKGEPLANALWLEGWLNLRFLNQPKIAYDRFSQMFDQVRTPVSKARAAYWAGRAAAENHEPEAKTRWFTASAGHITTFYGQLARLELHDVAPMLLPEEPSLTLFGSDTILSDDMEEAIRLCIEKGEHRLASRLIHHLIDLAETDRSILAVAELGHTLSAPHISVKAAKKAQQKGVILKNVGYPRPQTDEDLAIPRILALSIIRQESEFDPEAESPSGALGMMQLLPGTAKETAKKLEIPYDRDALDTAGYNIRLGSAYLARLIHAFDDSYILGIAAYNAGPGNVKKWIKQHGSPSQNLYETIDWIEGIPFAETRNYVQRVMENMQVYRALEGNSESLQLQRDLLVPAIAP